MAFYSLAENSFVYHYTHLVHIDCLSFISRVLCRAIFMYNKLFC